MGVYCPRHASRRTHEAPASPARHRDFWIGICDCTCIRIPAARPVKDFRGFTINTNKRDRAAVPNDGSEYAAWNIVNFFDADNASGADYASHANIACIYDNSTTLRANNEHA